jgi:hypothetical protein
MLAFVQENQAWNTEDKITQRDTKPCKNVTAERKAAKTESITPVHTNINPHYPDELELMI